jgi:NAD(P)-dependent dehydrogenase (short-subunit alcohol dehydrogenase family)
LDNKDKVASAQKVRATYEVDVVGLVDLTERLVPLMGQGGHVVNVDSVYGSFCMEIDDETSTAYRMAKAALNMYTRTLAFRLQDKGIVVSSLDPGWVKTDMGMSVATETDKPDREPEDAAREIYDLVAEVTESGLFWRFGKRREW